MKILTREFGNDSDKINTIIKKKQHKKNTIHQTTFLSKLHIAPYLSLSSIILSFFLLYESSLSWKLEMPTYAFLENPTKDDKNLTHAFKRKTRI